MFVDYFKFVLTPPIFDSIDTHSMVFIIASMPVQRFSLLGEHKKVWGIYAAIASNSGEHKKVWGIYAAIASNSVLLSLGYQR